MSDWGLPSGVSRRGGMVFIDINIGHDIDDSSRDLMQGEVARSCDRTRV
jgi:hypothetical protein